MPTIALKQGFYTTRGLIASAQRAVNLYGEKNPEDAEAPVSHYPTPGLTLLAAPPAPAPARGLFLSSQNQLFYVCGNTLFFVDQNWVISPLGTIPDAASMVGMQDNGLDLVLVDGTAVGYSLDLSNLASFAPIADVNFLGGDRVDYIGSFFVLNEPDTRNFYTSESNSLTFNALAIAAKSGYPDKLATLIVMHNETWVLGSQRSTEVWYVAGTSPFPLGIVQGVYIEQGCAAKYSVAKHDLAIFWLGVDQNGQKIVFMGNNYTAKRISTPAIAQEFSGYEVVSDAIGMTYMQQDHAFYVLTFPTANKTWVYDISENLWHERTWTDENGQENRIRVNCMTFAYGKVVGGDWETGNLYELDLNAETDNGSPIIRRRGFPHVVNEGKRAECSRFAVDMQTGESDVPEASVLAGDAESPKVYLRVSYNRGKTYQDSLEMELGAQGQFDELPQRRQLGTARFFTFEVFWSDPAFTAINGAWADFTPASA